MTTPVACEFINVRRAEGADEIAPDRLRHRIHRARPPVLLLKDVVNSGVIETYLIDHLRDDGAASVRLAAIVDKPPRPPDRHRRRPLALHGRGRASSWATGWSYEGRFAHLPYIAEIFADAGAIKAARLSVMLRSGLGVPPKESNG